MADNLDSFGWSSPSMVGSGPNPILIIGLGNPILGDDGVGWEVAKQLEAQLKADLQSDESRFAGCAYEIDLLSLGGISLMERLVGYKRVIIIDALTTRQHPVGTVLTFPLESLPDIAAGHLSSAHDTSLQTAINVGRSMGAQLPYDVIIVAVEAAYISDFSEELSQPVAEAVPEAVIQVKDLLVNWTNEPISPPALGS